VGTFHDVIKRYNTKELRYDQAQYQSGRAYLLIVAVKFLSILKPTFEKLYKKWLMPEAPRLPYPNITNMHDIHGRNNI
jgi:hypothetical protein